MGRAVNRRSRSGGSQVGQRGILVGALYAGCMIALGVGAVLAQPAQLDDTVILVVRHAERESQDANADLLAAEPGSGIGTARAQALAPIAVQHEVSAIYSTDFCRTAQTAQPAAALLGLTIGLMPTGSSAAGLQACDPPITVPTEPAPSASLPGIAEYIKTARAGRVTLVIGHSNTVPQLVEALSGTALCPDPFPPDDRFGCLIPDDENHHLYIVRITEDGRAALESTTYGAVPGR